MATRTKKPVHHVQMTEGKFAILQQLLNIISMYAKGLTTSLFMSISHCLHRCNSLLCEEQRHYTQKSDLLTYIKFKTQYNSPPRHIV